MSPDYSWHLVVDSKGNVEEAFNSKAGADTWVEDHGGIVIKVKEVQDNPCKCGYDTCDSCNSLARKGLDG